MKEEIILPEETNTEETEKKFNLSKLLKALAGIGITIGLVGAGFGLNFAVRPEVKEDGSTTTVIELTTSIELAEKHVPALLETEEGEIEVDLPTIEAVDAPNVTGLVECPEGETECGLGLYIYAPVETPQAFADYTLGGCYNTDGIYNEQCWDYGDLFFQNYAGRRLSTCGTGSAKGTWAGDCKFVNAGDEFALVYDAKELQYGDWAVFDNGAWGHIGMVVGSYNNGYIALEGQNQGGGLCEGSTMGGRVNIINISLAHFAGAFRPKAYIQPEPVPDEIPDTSHGF